MLSTHTCFRIFGLLMLSLSLEAATPVGWASTTGRMRVSGTEILSGAGPSPIVVGDVVVAIEAPVVVMLRRGGRVVLQKGSEVRIDQTDAELELRLQSGRLSFDLPEETRIALFRGAERISREAQTGQVAARPEQQQSGDSLPPRSRTGSVPSGIPGFRPPSPSQPCSGDAQARPPRSDCP